jgi:ADP-heptose:LPS heptosyltransferase
MYSPEQYQSIGKCFLSVHGGIGRNIMATAVIENMKKAYPALDIYVVAGCPEVFLRSPHVKRVHDLSHPAYLYNDYVLDKKALLLQVEPYQHYSYAHKEKHFTQCWCEMMNIPYVTKEPKIYFNISEQEMAKDYLKKFDRRMVLLQHQGGKIPQKKEKKEKLIAQAGMYKRNLPENVTQKVVDGLIAMGYMVGSVGHENQFLPKGAEPIKFPIRAICALIPYVEAVISIDSFLLHGAACFKDQVPVMALWGGTDPNVLGYEWHTNCVRKVCDTPMCHRPNSYLYDFEETGFMWDCPHNDICMNYEADQILEQFKTMMAKEKKDGEPREQTQEENHACREAKEPCDPEKCPVNQVTAGIGAG